MRVALLTGTTEPRGAIAGTLLLAEALARAGASVTVWALDPGGPGPSRRVDPAVRVRLVPFPDVPGEDDGARSRRAVAELGMAFAAAGECHDVVHARDAVGAAAVPENGPAVRAGWGSRAAAVPDGIDAGPFAAAAGPRGSAARGRWRARLGRYVLALGGVDPGGSTLDLVQAMATVQLVRPELTLVVAGGAPPRAREALDARAEELEVFPLVLDGVPPDELPALVASADVVACPAVREGWEAAALQALAAGVPVVAADLPPARELLGGAADLGRGPAGLAAGVLRAGGSDAGRVAAGRVLAAAHSWDAAARAHLERYRAGAPAQVRQPVGA